jgi:hypothetical protein
MDSRNLGSKRTNQKFVLALGGGLADMVTTNGMTIEYIYAPIYSGERGHQIKYPGLAPHIVPIR